MEEIAYALGKDPLEVRRANFYGDDHATSRPTTRRSPTTSSTASSTSWRRRRTTRRAASVLAHNAKGGVIRKGIALIPVKLASASPPPRSTSRRARHVYNDGSVHLDHGGTEMGQGLNTKVSQVVADVFQIDLDRVKITATTTAKVPNTSATAASSGSDLNGMAAQNAARADQGPADRLRRREVRGRPEQVVFEPNAC